MIGRISTVSLSVENQQNESKEETVDFEKAMEICGNGRYQYTLLLVCGMLFICVGSQYGISAYILPSAECDLNMGSEEKGFLNIAFLMGSVISALFWGVFAGAYGRRNIIILTLLGDGIVTLLASFSQGYKLLLIFRIISGFLMGAPGSLVYMYLGEFHAERHRTRSICFLGFFFPLSWLILPALAWAIIPLPISFEFQGMRYNSWRIFLGAIGLPTLAVAAVISTYPESPKFLVSQGKTDEALTVLQSIYEVKNLISEAMLNVTMDKTTSSLNTVMELWKNIWWQLRTMTSPPILQHAILLWTIYSTNMFGYYGLGLWMPELFNRFENYYQSYPNASVSVCELMHSMFNELNETVAEEPFVILTNGPECEPHIDRQVFINSLTINAVCLVGSIISGCLSNRVGRRTMPVTMMLVAGIAGFCLYFVKSSLQILIVATVFSLMITTANFLLAGLAVNIFPTHVSAAATCMMICMGRMTAVVSNLSFGMLLDYSCEIPIFLLAGVATLGGLLSFLIPCNQKK